MTNVPNDKKLYNQIKNKAKKKFKVWPSVYASSWLVREYKKNGGTYKTLKSRKPRSRTLKSRKPRSRNLSGLSRWYKEKWINVCKLPKKVPCGRSKILKSWKKNYPYCRPSVKVNSSTPKLSSELTKKEIRKRCINKKKSPLVKIK